MSDVDITNPSATFLGLARVRPPEYPDGVIAFPEPREARERRLRRARSLPHRLRLEARIVEALEKLEDLRQEFVARLDAMHGDPDLEPWISATAAGWNYEGPTDDREADADEEPDDGFEPSLGSPESGSRSQLHWGDSTLREEPDDLDREAECEDEGAQCDDEGHQDDLEPDCDDEGDAQARCVTVEGWPPPGTMMRPGAP